MVAAENVCKFIQSLLSEFNQLNEQKFKNRTSNIPDYPTFKLSTFNPPTLPVDLTTINPNQPTASTATSLTTSL